MTESPVSTTPPRDNALGERVTERPRAGDDIDSTGGVLRHQAPSVPASLEQLEAPSALASMEQLTATSIPASLEQLPPVPAQGTHGQRRAMSTLERFLADGSGPILRRLEGAPDFSACAAACWLLDVPDVVTLERQLAAMVAAA